MADRFPVSFSSTNDAELDAELIALEDEPQTLEGIVATCRKFGVRARFETSDGIMEINGEGVPRLWRPSTPGHAPNG